MQSKVRKENYKPTLFSEVYVGLQPSSYDKCCVDTTKFGSKSLVNVRRKKFTYLGYNSDEVTQNYSQHSKFSKFLFRILKNAGGNTELSLTCAVCEKLE